MNINSSHLMEKRPVPTGPTERITNLIHILTNGYMVLSVADGLGIYQRNFWNAEKTPEEVMAAVEIMVANNYLTFRGFLECPRTIQDYLIKEMRVEPTLESVARFLDFIAKAGEHIEPEMYAFERDNRPPASENVQWFQTGSAPREAYANLALHDQAILLRKQQLICLRKIVVTPSESCVVAGTLLKRMFQGLSLVDTELATQRDLLCDGEDGYRFEKFLTGGLIDHI